MLAAMPPPVPPNVNPTEKPMHIAYVFDLDDVLMPTTALFEQPAVREWINMFLSSNDFQQICNGYQRVVLTNPRLIQHMHMLNGPKFVLTNASRVHAHASLNALGIGKCFEGQLDATHGLPMKPHEAPFRYMQNFVIAHMKQTLLPLNGKNVHTNKFRIVFFDDRIENHIAPKRLGWTTVWIYGAIPADERIPYQRNIPHYIDMAFVTVEAALSYFVSRQG